MAFHFTLVPCQAMVVHRLVIDVGVHLRGDYECAVVKKRASHQFLCVLQLNIDSN